MSLGTLTVNLLMKTGQFETDTKRTEKRAKMMAANIDKTVKTIGFAFGAVAATGLTALTAAFVETNKYIDDLAQSAEQLGVSFKVFQELQYAAIQTDVEVETLTKSFAKLSEKVGSLSNGDGEKFAQTLKTIGINAQELQALSPEAQFEKIIGALSRIENVNQRATIANDIFGKSFKDLNPLINQGEEGLRALRQEAQDTGAVISDTAQRAFADYDNAMNTLKLTTKAALAEAFTPLAIFFTSQLDPALESSKTFAELLGKELLGLTADIQKALSGLKFYEDVAKGIEKEGLFGKGIISIAQEARAAERARDAGIDSAAAFAASGGGSTGNGNGRGRGIKVDIRGVPTAGSSGGASRAASSAAASQAEAAADRAAEKAARALDAANQSLNQTLNTQAAELGGPLVQAAQQYRDKLVELDAIEKTYADQGKLTLEVQQDLNLAREQAGVIWDSQQKAIQGQLTSGQAHLQQMQETLDLLKLTNDERVRAAFLIDNPDATASQAQQAVDLANQTVQTLQTIQAMDQLRNSAADAFESFLDGSKSAKEAFKDFADSVISQIARIVAQQAAEALFGSFGTTGASTGAGGFLSTLFGSLFGGGRASGGPVQGGMMYRVNENGPEILNYKGEDFLMMGGQGGFVKPNRGGGGSVINVNVSPTTDRRSAQQIAQRVAEKQRVALSRNS